MPVCVCNTSPRKVGDRRPSGTTFDPSPLPPLPLLQAQCRSGAPPPQRSSPSSNNSNSNSNASSVNVWHVRGTPAFHYQSLSGRRRAYVGNSWTKSLYEVCATSHISNENCTLHGFSPLTRVLTGECRNSKIKLGAKYHPISSNRDAPSCPRSRERKAPFRPLFHGILRSLKMSPCHAPQRPPHRGQHPVGPTTRKGCGRSFDGNLRKSRDIFPSGD